MAAISVTAIVVKDNPARLADPLRFEVRRRRCGGPARPRRGN